ncbi:MAG: hypothetical protein JOZ62_16560 [Acidobacteriaceae bacterium]|nr:hypothetical protein [Acidobacteriaceae bacterium]
MKICVFALFTAATLLARSGGVDVYTPQDLQTLSKKLAAKRIATATEELQRYGNHYTMIAFRDATGSSELHEKEADIFVVEEGEATLLTGGKLIHSHAEKPGELRGTSIEGGERHMLTKDSIVHIPAGTPHQLLIDKAKPFTYFVIKVIQQ